MHSPPISPLHEAALAGCSELVQAALAAGAAVDATAEWKGRCNVTPLMLAAQAGHMAAVSLLLAAGARLEANDATSHADGGQNPLHYAAAGGRLDVIEQLQRTGARLNALTRDGRSPLFEALAAGEWECARELLRLGANPNAGLPDVPFCLELAMTAGAKDIVAELKRHKAKRYPPASESDLPLSVAVRLDSPALLRAFLRVGAEASYRNARWIDWAIWEAVIVPREEMLAELLQAGADPNFAAHGDPALINAIRGFAKTTGPVRQLLAAGARPDARDTSGKTALMAAVSYFNPEMVRVVLEAGASVNLATEGRTALDTALAEAPKMKHDRELLQLLRDAGAKTAAELQTAGLELQDFEPRFEELEFDRPDFRAAAAEPAYIKLVARLADLTQTSASPMKHVAGGFSFSVQNGAELVTRERQSFLEAGAFLFLSHRGSDNGADVVSLIPTGRWQDAILALETNGANEQIYAPDVVAWLEKLAKTHPFDLFGAGPDWVEARFRQPVTDATKLAKRVYKFCPDVVDQGTGTAAALARDLEKTGTLYLWWD